MFAVVWCSSIARYYASACMYYEYHRQRIPRPARSGRSSVLVGRENAREGGRDVSALVPLGPTAFAPLAALGHEDLHGYEARVNGFIPSPPPRFGNPSWQPCPVQYYAESEHATSAGRVIEGSATPARPRGADDGGGGAGAVRGPRQGDPWALPGCGAGGYVRGRGARVVRGGGRVVGKGRVRGRGREGMAWPSAGPEVEAGREAGLSGERRGTRRRAARGLGASAYRDGEGL